MRRAAMGWLVGLAVLGGVDARALPANKAEKMVKAVRALKGVPYLAGGRLQTKGEGLDSQGIMFHAAEVISGCGWLSYSVLPTVWVKKQELGALAFGKEPLPVNKIKWDALKPGDMILLVGFPPNPIEGPIGKMQGKDVWVWHSGMYTGDGLWIFADQERGNVAEASLQQYMREYQQQYVGALVLRMKDGPKPAKCVKHSPMDRHRAGF